MKIKGWKYYNHAAIPSIPPHKKVDISSIKNRKIWQMDGNPLFARWTEDFDCGYETEWWFCIKDEPFEFNQVKSKRRTEIRKGLSLNEVKVVKAKEYIEQIYKIQTECYKEYPEQYRPQCSMEIVRKACEIWDEKHVVFMAFSVETNEVTGFACVEPIDDYVNFEILKVPQKYKKSQVVAALTYEIIIDMINKKKYKYICDGARNLVHKTNFMDYLIKQFAFRLAFCNLNMEYKPSIKFIIKGIYPFRKLLEKFSGNKLIYKLIAILKMEEIARACKNKNLFN